MLVSKASAYKEIRCVSATVYLVDGSLNPQIVETWGQMSALMTSQTHISLTGGSKAKQANQSNTKHSKATQSKQANK